VRRILLPILLLSLFQSGLSGLDESPGLESPPVESLPPGSAAGGQVRGAVNVYLHDSALLEGDSYTLGEVAALQSSDPGRSATLAAVPLGSTPNRLTLLPARVIRERLAPAVEGQVFVIGGRVALLPRAAVPEGQERFFANLLSFIDRSDPGKDGRIELELLSTPTVPSSAASLLAPGWQDRVVFELGGSAEGRWLRPGDSERRLPAGQMEVSYRLLSPGAAAPSGYPAREQPGGSFRVWLHRFVPVARAKTNLPSGYVLNEEVVLFSEEDLSLLPGGYLTRSVPLESYRTAAPIAGGAMIEINRLQRNLAVRAGDRIMIVFARPGLSVSLPGRALRSGSAGDIVEVRPERAAKRFQGRVASEGEVLVEDF
jgi:flagella basal body P-ring formation protein FlgA